MSGISAPLMALTRGSVAHAPRRRRNVSLREPRPSQRLPILNLNLRLEPRTGGRVVLVRSAKPYRGDERSFWDNAPVESRHKGYVPVPGFGEYYTPPAPPPEPEEDDEEEGDDRWTGPSRIRQQPPEEGRWGLNESQAAKGAYVPVPGFGEYYAPPAPGKPKGKANAGKEERDEDDSQDHAWASKVRSQPAEAGRWQPGDTAPYVPTPEPQAQQSRGWFGFGGGGGGGSDPAEDYYARDDQSWSEQQSFAHEEPLPSAFTDGAASNLSDYGDDELRRLRVIYGMFRKTVAALRYIVPFTGGLACWIAAAQTLTAWWTMASMVPFLTGLLTFSMFGFLVTLGAAFFSGMYMAVTVFTRTLRYMLDGRMTEAWPARDQAPQMPMQIAAQSEPAPPAVRRGAKTPVTVDYVPTTPLDDEAPDVPVSAILPELYAPPRAPASPPDLSDAESDAASGGGESPPAGGESSPNLGESSPDPMAAKPPPKRARVDLPLDVLLRVGGGAVEKTGKAVTGEREGGGDGYKELPPKKGKGGVEKGAKDSNDSRAKTEPASWDSAVREGSVTAAGELRPDPAAVQRREAVVPPSQRSTVASKEQQQQWLRRELEREWEDVGAGEDAPRESVRGDDDEKKKDLEETKEVKKNGGGWNPIKAFFGGGADESPAPVPPAAAPEQPANAEKAAGPARTGPAPTRAAPADAAFDPVMGALRWETPAGEATNANAQRAAEVAARLAARAAAGSAPEREPEQEPEPEPAAAVDTSSFAEEAAAAAVSEVRSQRRRLNDEDRKRAERNEWQKRVNGALRRERDDDR